MLNRRRIEIRLWRQKHFECVIRRHHIVKSCFCLPLFFVDQTSKWLELLFSKKEKKNTTLWRVVLSCFLPQKMVRPENEAIICKLDVFMSANPARRLHRVPRPFEMFKIPITFHLNLKLLLRFFWQHSKKMPQTWQTRLRLLLWHFLQKFRKYELFCMEKVSSEKVMKLIFPEISFIDKL